jgi:hypothetical protein
VGVPDIPLQRRERAKIRLGAESEKNIQHHWPAQKTCHNPFFYKTGGPIDAVSSTISVRVGKDPAGINYASTARMRPPRTITPIVPSFARPPPLIVSPFYTKATIDLKQKMEPVFFASNRFDILQILTGIHWLSNGRY